MKLIPSIVCAVAFCAAPLAAQDSSWPLADAPRPAVAPAPAPVPAPAAQDPSRRPVVDPNQPNYAGYPIYGGVEAPRQPVWASSSAVRIVERPLRGEAPGRSGQIRVRIRDIAIVRGQETNVIQGVGLVMGLDGSGDSGNAMTFALKNLLNTQNFNLDPNQIASNNAAVVWVQATLPPGVKPGRHLDARVSSMYDAEDLTGGSLVWCELFAPGSEDVYATVAGPITTGALSASGDGASAQRNHLTVGIVAQGAKVEREVPSELVTELGFLHLDLKSSNGSFGNAVRIANAVDTIFPGSAVPLDAMTVKVAVPREVGVDQRVYFINEILQTEFVPEASARVVVNERTGVVILGEEVRIGAGGITKGNLTVTVSETPETSQPGPLSNGTTETQPRTNLLIEEEERQLSIINGAATLQEVVEVLNVLGVTPRDMVGILQDLSRAGMLHGELVVM
jgi:flagellar P-ring protein FlgI